eukprot:13760684-Alexandrium_andersonii.AAC.1
MDTDVALAIMRQSDVGLACYMFDPETEQRLRDRRYRHDPVLALSFERVRWQAQEYLRQSQSPPNG